MKGLMRHHVLRQPKSAADAQSVCGRDEAENESSSSSSSDAAAPGAQFRYVFWSDDAIRDFLADGASRDGDMKRHFELSRHFGGQLDRTDVARYLFIYEFGGVYLDMDVEVLRSFVPYLERGYPCVLSEENAVQVRRWWNGDNGVTNSVILCRPRHPFFKLLIESLEANAHRQMFVVERTGPRFLTPIVERYRKSNPKLTELCDKDPAAHNDCLVIEPPFTFEGLNLDHTKTYVSLCRETLSKLPNPSPTDAHGEPPLIRHCRLLLESLSSRGSPVELPTHLSDGRLSEHHYLSMGYKHGADRSGGSHYFTLQALLNGHCTYKKDKGLVYVDSKL